jgi:hypothetical protein
MGIIKRLLRKPSGNGNIAYQKWKQRGYAVPSPHYIKMAVVVRNGLPDATWVETGTYRGRTTRRLAGVGKKVYSIEPEPTLYADARKAFAGMPNVELINDISENVFPGLLPTLRGDICFWLDGHFSAGATFKGPQDTPIVEELACITQNLATMGKVSVMVDDVRCFNPNDPDYSTYPPLDFLVDWARQNKMNWHIEHDIFVARNY